MPMLDEVVIESTLAADSETFISGGFSKLPLRNAARGFVSDTVINRPESGLGGPARAWFQGVPGNKLDQRIEAVAETGLVTKDTALHIHRAASSGRQDAALAAWALVCLHSWHQEHN